MSLALGEVELDLETSAVFGNLAKDSAQAFAAALTGLSPAVHPTAADPERPPKAPKLELGKRGRPSDSSYSGGRNHGQGQGNKGQGKGGKGGKTSPQVTALVKAMGRLVIRQETQLQILKQNSAWWVYLQPGVNGPIPVLFKAAEKYKEQAKVKFMEAPIRVVLLSTGQSGGPADHRHANPTGGPPTRGAGQRSPEASSSVLRLTLHDPAHQSYINAFVQTYLWCFSLLQVPEFQVFGSRVQAWRDVLYSTQANLVVSRLPAWRGLLKGWRRPASPHDVVEFCSHLLQVMQPPILQAGWESRALSGEAAFIVHAAGMLTAPLALQIQPDHCTVQDCIDSWHAQASTHALTTAASCLILSLARYGGSHGGAVRSNQSLVLPATLTVPVFGRGIKCFRAKYHAVGFILHSGPSPTEGRYSAILRTKLDCDRGSCRMVQTGRQAVHTAAAQLCLPKLLFADAH